MCSTTNHMILINNLYTNMVRAEKKSECSGVRKAGRETKGTKGNSAVFRGRNIRSISTASVEGPIDSSQVMEFLAIASP